MGERNKMRSHSASHRHRRDSEHTILPTHYDPGWGWNRRTTTMTTLLSPRSEPRTRPTALGSFTSAVEESAAAGNDVNSGATGASRVRATAAAYGAPNSYVTPTKPLSPPLLSGQSRLNGLGGVEDMERLDVSRHGNYSTRRSSLDYGASPVVWGGRGTATAEDAAIFGVSNRLIDRSAAARQAAMSSRISVAAVAGSPLQLKAVDSAAPPPPVPPTPPPSSYLIPPPQRQDVGKLVVVLDLDETLVYSRDVTLYERPGVVQLLKTLKGRCELIVWTAGTRDYALDVIRVIDTVCAVQHCIYRHPMWWSGDAGCTKDLRMLGRPMDRVILVDNTPSVFRANPRNSLLVTDFLVPFPRSYNAQEKVLSTLADIFDHVFRRFTQPCLADVLASKRIVRQLVYLEKGNAVELNVLTLRKSVDSGWTTTTRLSRARYSP